MLRITSVAKSFGLNNTVLNNIELTVGGDTRSVALVGPSGCGKTTLLRVIAGHLVPDSGSIYVGDLNYTACGAFDRPIATVSQQIGLFPHLTAAGNIRLGFSRSGRKVSNAELIAWADRFDLTQAELSRRPIYLSGGQQQRVALARAIASKPKVLLLDEPLSHIDTALRPELRQLIKAVSREFGVLCVWVTHDVSDALDADLVGVLLGGSIAQIDSPETVFKKPVSLTVAKLMGPVNVMIEMSEYVTILRPRDLSLCPLGSGLVNATVTHISLSGGYGASRVISLLDGEGRSLLALSNNTAVSVGDALGLTWSPEKLHTCKR